MEVALVPGSRFAGSFPQPHKEDYRLYMNGIVAESQRDIVASFDDFSKRASGLKLHAFTSEQKRLLSILECLDSGAVCDDKVKASMYGKPDSDAAIQAMLDEAFGLESIRRISLEVYKDRI